MEGNLSKVSLKDNISIVGFWGGDIENKKSEALNLNQKIYKRFYEFQDFQFVFLYNETESKAIEDLKLELISGVGTDLKKWKFIPASQSSIKDVFDSFNVVNV